MFLRSCLIALFGLTVVTARAEDEHAQDTRTGPADSVGSEYLHQALGGNFELSPEIRLTMMKVENKTDSRYKATTATLPVFLRGEYGFSDLFSLGLKLGMGVGSTNYTCPSPSNCNDTVSSGLFDPELSANFRIPAGITAIRFGAVGTFSLSDRKVTWDGDTNLASGGTRITPYAGVEVGLGRNLLGAKISVDALVGDRSVSKESKNLTTGATTTTKFKETDGQRSVVGLFYEYNFPRIVAIGSSLDFTNSAGTKDKLNGTSTKNNDRHSAWLLNVYVPLRFTTRATLVPSFAVGSHQYESKANVKATVDANYGVYARFVF